MIPQRTPPIHIDMAATAMTATDCDVGVLPFTQCTGLVVSCCDGCGGAVAHETSQPITDCRGGFGFTPKPFRVSGAGNFRFDSSSQFCMCVCCVGAWGERGAGGSNSIYNHILAVTDFLICRKGLLMCHCQADGFQVVVAVHNLRRQQYRQALRRSQQQVNECCCCHCQCSDDVSQR